MEDNVQYGRDWVQQASKELKDELSNLDLRLVSLRCYIQTMFNNGGIESQYVSLVNEEITRIQKHLYTSQDKVDELVEVAEYMVK